MLIGSKSAVPGGPAPRPPWLASLGPLYDCNQLPNGGAPSEARKRGSGGGSPRKYDD
jgi:hypothetical protein